MGRLDPACERAHRLASLAVDGELSELERSALLTHEAGCPDCARYRSAVATAARLLRESEPEQPSTVLVLPATRRRAFGRLQLAAAAAAVAAALAAGSLAGLLSSGGTPSATRSEVSAHRLLIQQSLLALATADTGKDGHGGRMVVL